MKICILILSTKNKSYDCFKYAIRSTWLSDFNNNAIDCFFYEGDSDKDQLLGDTIYLSVKDEYKYTFLKFYKCLEYLKSINKKYDFYFRANLSCYIDILKFIEFINHYNIDSNSYCGKLGVSYLMSELTLKYKLLRSFQGKFKIGKKINYYSGAGFFIGSNKVELILKYGNYFKNSFIIDDVLIGLLLFSCENSKSNNNILKILEINIDSGFKLSKKDYSNLIKTNHLFFYRFKNFDRIKDSEYLIKFANPILREHLILNGFRKEEKYLNRGVQKIALNVNPSRVQNLKFNLIYFYFRLIFSYMKIISLVFVLRSVQAISKNYRYFNTA